jgi:hypothetical protein
MSYDAGRMTVIDAVRGAEAYVCADVRLRSIAPTMTMAIEMSTSHRRQTFQVGKAVETLPSDRLASFDSWSGR